MLFDATTAQARAALARSAEHLKYSTNANLLQVLTFVMANSRQIAVAAALLALLVLLLATSGSWSGWLEQLRRIALSYYERSPALVALVGVVLIASWIVALIPSTPIEIVVAYVFGLGGGFALIYVAKV